MLNIEKYKDEIFNRINECELAKAIYLVKEGKMDDCDRKCKLCRDAYVKWLIAECKEPVLDDKEREYLSYGIRPFREKIECIYKHQMPYRDEYYIVVRLKDGDSLMYPRFKGNTMYKGMEVEKEYTLEELGL